MSASSTLLASTLTAVIAMSAAAPAVAASKEKCYGVAAAGKNDCAANGHSCAGQAKLDKDPAEWKYVAAGSCAQLGGMLQPDSK
ncbi:hypothetical protein ACG97_02800 [Vogesella sp. EB]|uniref:BufA1 family periplasmic bufferin-type metallophore n=1 Tax=Vogesella sp. EB TaxID=1526735 RepID=UPI00064D1D23|nr:DUF2282 domain-containing protein [Vogesella sp. EB]KMJ54678.1 hypothetical protein ACG97_02800 [Vogesella sp. EB]